MMRLDLWQEKIDQGFSVTEGDRAELDRGTASYETLARIYRQAHGRGPEVAAQQYHRLYGKFPWEEKRSFNWPWRAAPRPSLALRIIDVRVTTYRYWWPSYGEVYKLASQCLLEAPRPDAAHLALPLTVATLRITGPVRAYILDGMSPTGEIIALTLLPGADVVEAAPGVPNPGDLIRDPEGNIVIPAAD